jgi:hypothetical protein
MIVAERVIAIALWVLLLAYALLLAPPPAPDTFDQALAMLLLDSSRVDPIAIAIFNLLGVLPAAFMALILFDTGRPNPWPFALGAFVLGGFVLLPYLALRDIGTPLERAPRPFQRMIGSRTAGATFLTLAVALIGFAAVSGSPGTFAAQLQESKLTAVMTADLIAMTIALHVAAATDRRRRAVALDRPAATAVRLPLVGPLLYLALRADRADGTR